MIAPGAAPLTLTTVGVLTTGAEQVAFTVASAVPLWPFPETTTWMPYDFGSAGVKVVGLVEVDDNALASASEDHANVYVGANRAGHFDRSESAEKCDPVAGDAVSVHGSIGIAPVACVVPIIAVMGAAPQTPDEMSRVRKSALPQWSCTVAFRCHVLFAASATKVGVADVAFGENETDGGITVLHEYVAAASAWLV